MLSLVNKWNIDADYVFKVDQVNVISKIDGLSKDFLVFIKKMQFYETGDSVAVYIENRLILKILEKEDNIIVGKIIHHIEDSK
jgi:hypothetical protein